MVTIGGRRGPGSATCRRRARRSALALLVEPGSSYKGDAPMQHANRDNLGEVELDPMVESLTEADGPADESGAWPSPLWAILARSGATRWALPRAFGGEECDRPTLLRRYARVAEGSMTAAFILSQHDAGVRRLVAALDRPAARRWVGAIAGGSAFTTVGISQLTTSRR